MMHNTSEAAAIYDAPAPHMTLPALYRYAGVDLIEEIEGAER